MGNEIYIFLACALTSVICELRNPILVPKAAASLSKFGRALNGDVTSSNFDFGSSVSLAICELCITIAQL